MAVLFVLYLLLVDLTCKNAENKFVDYWAAFNTPMMSTGNKNEKSGFAFYYTDESTPLSQSRSYLNSTIENPLYYTLSPIYDQNPNVGYVLINDQPPSADALPSPWASMKGVLLFDETSALYIEHSCPQFPADPKTQNAYEYEYANNCRIYAQNFLCMNLDGDSLKRVTEAFLIQRPVIYASNIPDFSSTRCPALKKALNSEWNTKHTSLVTEINSGKNRFILFAKSSTFGLDIYHDLITPTLQANSYSQSWSQGTSNIPSNCSSQFFAFNIININFLGTSWTRLEDNSKWALVGEYVFMGGTNRQTGQLRRGGGGFALKNSKWVKEMQNVIVDYEECDGNSYPFKVNAGFESSSLHQNEIKSTNSKGSGGDSKVLLFVLALGIMFFIFVYKGMKEEERKRKEEERRRKEEERRRMEMENINSIFEAIAFVAGAIKYGIDSYSSWKNERNNQRRLNYYE